MIHDTLKKIEDQLQSAPALKPESRKELLTLVATLKDEVSELSKTDAEQAQTIVGFTQVSTHEATRETPNPKLVKLSLDGLAESVTGFEESHPRLVKIVNSISSTLSNWGI